MKIAVVGYGKMGRMIDNISDNYEIEVVERFDVDNPMKTDDATEEKLKDIKVLIDFTVPGAVLENVRTAAKLSKHIVVGTTGWADQLDEIQDIVTQAEIGFVHASNFSLGVNLFYQIIDHAGQLFSAFENYDPYLEECHHKFKKDAPSGTALVLKQILEKQYKRSDFPITSVRAGYIPGTHAVSFDSTVDTIRLQHTARSREGFAAGALLAAKWIADRKGFFGFDEVLRAILQGKA